MMGWNGRVGRVARGFLGAGTALLLAAPAGCLQILGDEGPFVLATGGSAGAGGTGGAASACEPKATDTCYEGPEGTVDVGQCRAGTHTCGDDGSWGACTDQVQPGVETCASKDDEDCDGNECARWSLMSGGDAAMAASALATDPAGNVLLAGGIGDGQATLGDKTVDGPLMVVKLDPAGTPQWVKSFGGPNVQFALPRWIDSDAQGNAFVGGDFEAALELTTSTLNANGRDIFIFKLTPGGAEAWAFGLGGDMDQYLWQMTVTSDGDPLLTGTYGDGIKIGGTSVGGSGAFVVRLSSSNGAVASVKHFDTLVGEYVSPSISAGPANTWFLAGECGDGATIDTKVLATCSNFIAKFGTDDSAEWAVALPALPSTIAVAPDGSIHIGGYFTGSVNFGAGPMMTHGKSDLFVAKLDADGVIQWAKTFGGTGDEYFSGLTVDAQGRTHVVISGNADVDLGGGVLKNSGLSDMLVLSLDSNGEHRWSRAFGDATLQSGLMIDIQNGDGGLIVSLNTPGEINFGAGALLPTGPSAVAIAKLAP